MRLWSGSIIILGVLLLAGAASAAHRNREAVFNTLHGDTATSGATTAYCLVKVQKGKFEACRKLIQEGNGQVHLSYEQPSGFLGLRTTYCLLVEVRPELITKLTAQFWAEPVTRMSGKVTFSSHETEWASSGIIESVLNITHAVPAETLTYLHKVQGDPWGLLNQDHHDLYERHLRHGSAWGAKVVAALWVEASYGRQYLYDRTL
jgi:hypothetical protein